MVAVVEVLEHHLPVPRQAGERERAGADGVGELVVGEERLVALERRGEWRGGRVEVDEDEAVPLLDLQAGQAPLRLVERRRALHRRRAEQAAVEGVAPVVVRALERRRVAGSLAHLHRPVPAHRRQGVDRARLVAGDDDRLVAVRRREPVAAVRGSARRGRRRATRGRTGRRARSAGPRPTCTAAPAASTPWRRRRSTRRGSPAGHRSGPCHPGPSSRPPPSTASVCFVRSADVAESTYFLILPTLVRGSSSTKR